MYHITFLHLEIHWLLYKFVIQVLVAQRQLVVPQEIIENSTMVGFKYFQMHVHHTCSSNSARNDQRNQLTFCCLWDIKENVFGWSTEHMYLTAVNWINTWVVLLASFCPGHIQLAMLLVPFWHANYRVINKQVLNIYFMFNFRNLVYLYHHQYKNVTWFLLSGWGRIVFILICKGWFVVGHLQFPRLLWWKVMVPISSSLLPYLLESNKGDFATNVISLLQLSHTQPQPVQCKILLALSPYFKRLNTRYDPSTITTGVSVNMCSSIAKTLVRSCFDRVKIFWQ